MVVVQGISVRRRGILVGRSRGSFTGEDTSETADKPQKLRGVVLVERGMTCLRNPYRSQSEKTHRMQRGSVKTHTLIRTPSLLSSCEDVAEWKIVGFAVERIQEILGAVYGKHLVN